ncbi:transposase [Streptomyces sp. NPDC055189]
MKASETVSKATRGWDGGKLINGRKRHVICDHRSLVLLVMVTPADAQDSLAARELLIRLALMHPEIAIVWADSAYAKNGLVPLSASGPGRWRVGGCVYAAGGSVVLRAGPVERGRGGGRRLPCAGV